MIILPDLYTIDSAFLIVISTEKSNIPPMMLRVCNIMYWGSYGISIALINVHFVFRYLVVTGNKVWTSSKPSKLLIWLLYPILFGGIHAAGCRFFAGPTNDTRQFLKEVIHNGSSIEITDMDEMGFYVYPINKNGTQHVNWKNVIGMVQNSVEISCSGTVMFVFGMKCYRAIASLSSKQSMSNRYQTVQKQLFSALVLQTLIPLFLMYIPSGFIILFCVLDQSIELFGRTLCITIGLYPVLDPLPNMFVIDSFRKALIRYIKKLLCIKRNKAKQTSSGMGTATQSTTF